MEDGSALAAAGGPRRGAGRRSPDSGEERGWGQMRAWAHCAPGGAAPQASSPPSCPLFDVSLHYASPSQDPRILHRLSFRSLFLFCSSFSLRAQNLALAFTGTCPPRLLLVPWFPDLLPIRPLSPDLSKIPSRVCSSGPTRGGPQRPRESMCFLDTLFPGIVKQMESGDSTDQSQLLAE